MSDRSESNLEYRAEFDFTQARAQILSIQESLRTMEEIGLAAFISIEDRAKTSAGVLAATFADAAKASGVSQIVTEVNQALAAVEKLKQATTDMPLGATAAVGGETPTSAPDSPVGASQAVAEAGTEAAAAGEAARTAAAGFGTMASALGLSGEEADAAEAMYARLLAQELKLQAGTDQLAKEFIDLVAAGRPTGEFLTQAAGQTTRLSQEQIRYAEAQARIKTAIQVASQAGRENNEVQQRSLQIVRQHVSALEAADEAARGVGQGVRSQTTALNQNAAAATRNLEVQKGVRREQEQAARLFERIIRLHPQQAQQLNDLVDKYGSFTVVLRASGQAMNSLEQEIQDTIRANPQLGRELDILNRRVGDLTLRANPTTFKGGGANLILSPDDIRKAGFALERFGITGVAAFGEIFAAVGPAGLAIGAVIVSIVTLTKLFSNLARAGVQAFEQLISKSIEVGRQTEVTQAQFEAFYKGVRAVPDAFAASEATLKRLGELSVKYGQDFTQLGRSLIPNVSGLDQLEEAVKLAASLATIDPTAGIEGAKEAIRSGLGGDLTPLYRRFEIPKATIDRIRELQEELGASQGLIVGLGEYFQATGQDIDSLADTANVAIGRVNVLRTQFERTTGAPIIEQIKESLGELFDLLDGREDEIFAIADAIGRSVASIIDLITGFSVDFLEKIDTAEMKEFVFDMREAVDALLSLFATITRGGDDTAGLFSFILDKITFVLEITEAWAAGTATVLAILQTVSETMLILISQATLFALGLAGSKDALERALEIDTGAEIAASWERNIAAVQGFVTRSQEAREENEAFTDSLDDSTAQAEDDADAALQLADARRKLAEVTEALAESQEKVADAREEYNRERNRALIEMEIEQTRKLTDALIENARKRVESALENVRKVQDIFREYKQDVADADLELARDREDIARDEADRLEDIAKQSADERLKIELEYLRKVEDLKRKFAFDSQEAIRANDAIAYLRLQRKLQFDLEQAKIDRDRKLADVDDKDESARDDEARKRERDRRDAQIDHDRKLEDLRIALEREIKERVIAYQRELQDLATAEQQKRDDLNRSFEQQKEDFDRNWRNKLTDLERNLQEEFSLIVANEKKKQELLQQAWEAERRLLRQQAAERQAIINQQGGSVRPRYGDENGGFVPDYDQGEGAGGPPPPGRGRPNYNFTDEEVEVMRQRARDLARRMGNDELLKMISSMTTQQLVTLLRSAGIPLRDTGGHVRTGEPVQVGKPELLIPGTSGFIYPLDMLRPMFNPPVTNNTTNNNRQAEVNLSMLDPSMVDLQRRQIMKQMLKEVLADVL